MADNETEKVNEKEITILPSSTPDFYGKREIYGNNHNPNPNGPKTLIRFRPDYPLKVKTLKNGVEEITGVTGFLLVGNTTVLYNRQGKIFDQNDPKRVAFSTWTDSTIRGEGWDKGIAIMAE